MSCIHVFFSVNEMNPGCYFKDLVMGKTECFQCTIYLVMKVVNIILVYFAAIKKLIICISFFFKVLYTLCKYA